MTYGMAVSRASESVIQGPQGYPLNICEDVDSKYLCGRCHLILRNPIQSFCGHRFCRDCFDHLIAGNAEVICSLCEQEDTVTEYSKLSPDQTFPDNALKREFSKLSARCPFPGCSWSGSFKDFEGHYMDCEFAPAMQNEEQSLRLDDKSFVETYQKLLARITSTDNFVAQLAGRVDKVEQDLRHLDAEAGSGTPARETAVVPLLSSSGGASSSGATAGGSSVAGVDTPVLKETEEKMKMFEGIVTILDREMVNYWEQMFSMERQDRLFQDLMITVNRKATDVEHTMANKDIAVADLDTRVGSMDQTSYDGTLLWRISNFQQRRQDAINGRSASIYSPPFYTSKTGYKMCARIYLNGDGMGKGSHVSLFFVLMRGEYDALLRWPFRQKVTMMFLDQNNRENAMDSFRPDPTSSSFKRPTAVMNIASGCPLFMPLTALDSPTHAYVRDNTAFIKVLVNLEGINS